MANGLTRVIEAVRWRVLDRTVNRVREVFADLPSDELNRLIDEAVASVRRKKDGESQASP